MIFIALDIKFNKYPFEFFAKTNLLLQHCKLRSNHLLHILFKLNNDGAKATKSNLIFDSRLS